MGRARLGLYKGRLPYRLIVGETMKTKWHCPLGSLHPWVTQGGNAIFMFSRQAAHDLMGNNSV